MVERAIRYVENGQRQSSMDMIQKVFEALGVHTLNFNRNHRMRHF